MLDPAPKNVPGRVILTMNGCWEYEIKVKQAIIMQRNIFLIESRLVPSKDKKKFDCCKSRIGIRGIIV